MAATKVDASSVAGREFQTPTTARSVPFRRRIATAAQKLSTWAVPRQICSTSGRSTGLKKDKIAFSLLTTVCVDRFELQLLICGCVLSSVVNSFNFRKAF